MFEPSLKEQILEAAQSLQTFDTNGHWKVTENGNEKNYSYQFINRDCNGFSKMWI